MDEPNNGYILHFLMRDRGSKQASQEERGLVEA